MADSFDAICKIMQCHPVLSSDLELELIRQYRMGGTAARQAQEKLTKHNLKLVVKIAKRHQFKGVDLVDLIQAGSIGMQRGFEKFEPSKGHRLGSYLSWWIFQGITREIAKTGRSIKLPARMEENLSKIRKADSKLYKSQIPATAKQLAKQSQLSVETVQESLFYSAKPCSLNLLIGEDKTTELESLLPSSEDPMTKILNDSDRQYLEFILGKLPEIERTAIVIRYGFYTGEESTIEETGKQLGVSKNESRAILARAMRKLKAVTKKYPHSDYGRAA